MRIVFECTGGYANLNLTYRANTDELPDEESQALLALINSSNVMSLAQSDIGSDQPGPPDVFHYKLHISDSGASNALECNDVTAPASLHPLLAKLRDLAVQSKMG